MLEEHVVRHLIGDDPLVLRNYETADPERLDALHREAHEEALAAYLAGNGPLRVVHALALSSRTERMQALCEPAELLKAIGLYDTWLDFFAEVWTAPDLRAHGTGEDPGAHAFVNVAFILYSLGMGPVALPFLEVFYERFPDSRLTPTVIYAQSMTYGRYQLPVDLPRASALAERNIEIIDEKFTHLDTYAYIKIFAENALAYVRARQGRLDEALELCTSGLAKMDDVYGPVRFKLHRSILIYNTAQIYEIMKDYATAEAYYVKSIELDPHYGEYRNDLGNLLARIPGREEEALAAYEQAIELCPSYYEAHLNRAVLLQRMGRSEDAIVDCSRVLDIKPSERAAALLLGKLLIASGRAAEAIAHVDTARHFGETADLMNNLAVARLEMSDPTGAAEACRRAVELNPRLADAHNNLAIACHELGDAAAAVVHAQEAVRLAPHDRDYAANYAFAVDKLRVAS